jgi:membrane protein DedA with SNARE-associated domain
VLDKNLIYELVGWFILLVTPGFLINPVPEEVLIASAGIRAAAMPEIGALRWLYFPVVIVGAVVADVVLYLLGRLFGARLLELKVFQKLASEEKRERIKDNFHRYGFVIFLVGRLVPGIRTTLFLTSGMMRLSLVRFCLADGLGAIVGGTLFFFLGYGLGSHFLEIIESIEKRIAPYKATLILFVLGAVAAYLLYVFLRRPIPTGDPEEVPIIGHQIATHLPDKSDYPPPKAPAAESQESESGTRTEARG